MSKSSQCSISFNTSFLSTLLLVINNLAKNSVEPNKRLIHLFALTFFYIYIKKYFVSEKKPIFSLYYIVIISSKIKIKTNPKKTLGKYICSFL